MDQQPDDRCVSSGAVVAAWAIVGGLVAVSLFTSVLAPPARLPVPLTAQAAADVKGCVDETETPDGQNGSVRE
jgi:hypothetical protein